MTGLMIAGMGMLAFVTRAGLGSGPNLSCTALYLTLLYIVRNGHVLGNKFHLLVDGTASDNKNNELIYFLAWLVETDVFDEASFFCMIVGHTFSRIDQSFRTMIVKLLAVPVWTVLQLLAYITEFLSPYDIKETKELHCLQDWKAFFEPYVTQRFGGFATGQYGSGMHEFVLRKNRHGKACLWLRKSSRASGWLPEGEGYQVFKQTPAGLPGLAKAHENSKWGKDSVLATVRAWFRYMSLNDAALARVKSEWEDRFDSLPPADGDMEQLAEWMKCGLTPSTVGTLPKRTELPIGACSSAAAGLRGGATSVLENPLVNPVTGLGRTAADVTYEHERVKSRLRDESSIAIFQSDYVFLRTSAGIQLHRVANALVLDDALAPELSFTTVQYEHEPQPGYSGFFGHFKMAPNPDYKPKDKKPGHVFLRMTSVSRADILVYNVQTFALDAPAGAEVKKHLYVHLESLQQLAAATQAPAIQEQAIPRTHDSAAPPQETVAFWRQKSVPELRAELEKRGLPTDGLKAVLIARLVDGGEGGGSGGNDDGDDGNEGGGSGDDNGNSGDDADESHDGDESDENDVPVDDFIPEGWKPLEEFGAQFKQFMLWACFSQNEPAQWHRMVVLKVLRDGRADGFTHDAHIFGQQPSKTKRGVGLSKNTWDMGSWRGIREIGAELPPPPPNVSPRAQAAPKPQSKRAKPQSKRPQSQAQQPASDRASKRVRKAVVPMRVNDNSDGLAHRAR